MACPHQGIKVILMGIDNSVFKAQVVALCPRGPRLILISILQPARRGVLTRVPQNIAQRMQGRVFLVCADLKDDVAVAG